MCGRSNSPKGRKTQCRSRVGPQCLGLLPAWRHPTRRRTLENGISGETAMFDAGKRLLCSLLVASALALVGLVSCTQAVNTPLVPRDRRVLSPKQTGCGASQQVMLRIEETGVLPEAVTP